MYSWRLTTRTQLFPRKSGEETGTSTVNEKLFRAKRVVESEKGKILNARGARRAIEKTENKEIQT